MDYKEVIVKLEKMKTAIRNQFNVPIDSGYDAIKTIERLILQLEDLIKIEGQFPLSK